jgi:hypothetical protein
MWTDTVSGLTLNDVRLRHLLQLGQAAEVL